MAAAVAAPADILDWPAVAEADAAGASEAGVAAREVKLVFTLSPAGCASNSSTFAASAQLLRAAGGFSTCGGAMPTQR